MPPDRLRGVRVRSLLLQHGLGQHLRQRVQEPVRRVRHGQLRQHGTYYFVNGLLKHFDTEGVISLIAPRERWNGAQGHSDKHRSMVVESKA